MWRMRATLCITRRTPTTGRRWGAHTHLCYLSVIVSVHGAFHHQMLCIRTVHRRRLQARRLHRNAVMTLLSGRLQR